MKTCQNLSKNEDETFIVAMEFSPFDSKKNKKMKMH